jgi:ABC-type antimicrobial peptide transport system permease subunit
MGNVIVRGVSPEALELRKQVKITQGKSFAQGLSEIIVGKSIARRFQGCNVGQTLKFGSRTWTIVGIFDAQKSGFDSEIWADVEQMQAAFNRPVFSTTTVRLKNVSDLSSFKARLQADPRLNSFEVKNEREFFAEQSEGLAKFISVLGLVITIIFSFGAMIGAMITMYASVAHRTVEIGTLRSLGFQRRSILSAFLIEALLLSLIGGGIGLVFASYLQTVTISTLNFATFSELAFGFDLSVPIVVGSLLFAAAMGIMGGFLPAVSAARLNIVNALRSE